MSQTVIDIIGDAGTEEVITGDNTVKQIAAAVIAQTINGKAKIAIAALITCETFAVNMTFSGNDPAIGSGVGHELAVGDSYMIRGSQNVKNWKCRNRVTDSNGIVKVTPFFL